ncbi:MAG: FlgD immunoglobulin-like domain containing protein, partial [Calditrichia bacterium]
YTAEDSLKSGQGYWIRFPAAKTEMVAGYPLNSLTIDMRANWNLIAGGTACNVAVNDVSDPGSIIISGTLFGFSGAYYLSDSIRQGEGYWLRTTSAGQIGLACGAVASPQLAKRTGQLVDLSRFPAMEISDAGGAGQTLYFNVELPEGASKLSYSLPPLPPAGAFDVRFAGDYRISETDEALINIQSSAYPVTISAENLPVDKHHQYVLTETGTDKVHILKAGEAVQLTSPAVTSLRLSRKEIIPLEFAVQQNYPNPFNPETKIEYALPENGPVDIIIYNTLGQKVRTLVSGYTEAGYHEVRWDGSNDMGNQAASGLYFYLVKAGKHQVTKKMLMLR